MTFEDDLRQRLQHDAATISLPPRQHKQATERARRRQRRRLAGAGIATVAALAALAPVVLHDNDPQQVSVASAGTGGTAVLPAGPLTLDWTHQGGGLSAFGVSASAAQFADGTLYALSTAPGARYDDSGATPVPKALYRLADDGTWQPLALDGARPRAMGIAADASALYAVSTGPGTAGHTAAVLSAPADKGDTWTSQMIAPAPDPSTVTKWDRAASAAVASDGETTLALVTTSFWPDQAGIFPELAGSSDLSVEQRPDGLALVRLPASTKEDVEAARKQKLADASGAPVPATAAPGPSSTTVPAETVRVVPWAQLGVTGPADFAARSQLYRRSDGAWVPLAAPVALSGVSGVQLQSSGAGFVATGWSESGGGSVVASTADGVTWSAVPLPVDGQVFPVGSALVEVPYEGTVLQVSADQGRTWRAVDLADHGVASGSWLSGSSAGGLGFATIATPGPQGGAPLLVTTADLADWSVGPVAAVTGTSVVQASTLVTADHVVVSAQTTLGSSADPARSVTAVGTPVRHR